MSTHGKSIDEVDRSIVEARTSLNEVTQELQERVHRWKQIELLCGFNIVNNNGLQYLENTLYRGMNGRGLRGIFIMLICMVNKGVSEVTMCAKCFGNYLLILLYVCFGDENVDKRDRFFFLLRFCVVRSAMIIHK